jgi:uncharacterized OB-fold protein
LRVADKDSTKLPPAPDGLNAEFYAWCAKGELRFQHCTDCGRLRHLPRILCANCGSGKYDWVRSSGKGRLFSWTVTHQAMHPALANDVPYTVAVAELEEGVRMVARLRGIERDALKLDLPLEVGFENVSSEVAVPYLKLRTATSP